MARDTGSGLTRRQCGLAACAAFLARPAFAQDAASTDQTLVPREISCRVFRAGSQIGTALYHFDRAADGLTVTVDVDLHIALGFITLYRYTHHNTENWQSGRLLGFSATTNINGKPNTALARWNGGGFDVDGTVSGHYVAPPNAIGTSYWNPRTLSDPLIDTANGKLLKVQLTPVGPSEAEQSNGAKVPASEYRMSGDLRMNLWYDDAKRLAGLQYFARDGSVITYEKA